MSGLWLPAPAKLNLRLRILRRRADGMHELESDAALLDFGDRVRIVGRDDGCVRRLWTHAEVAEDVCVRAAHALRKAATESDGAGKGGVGGGVGADIFVEKRIPVGGGLGGASSDAATVLLGLNHLWGLDFSRGRLMELGAALGADIPFFLSGLCRARMGGIGDRILPDSGGAVGGFVVLAHPGVSAGTAAVYAAYDSRDWGGAETELTSAAKSAIITLSRWNDLAEAACFLRPRIAECARALEKAGGEGGEARITGSGSCVFSVFGEEAVAGRVCAEMKRQGWMSWTARILDSHPLRDFAGGGTF